MTRTTTTTSEDTTMSTIILTRTTTTDAWMAAVAADYNVPEAAHMFMGWGLHGERVAFWIDADGGGFGCTDADPDGYVRLSAAFASGDERRISDAMNSHGGVNEFMFDKGSFRYNAETLEVKANTSFGGI